VSESRTDRFWLYRDDPNDPLGPGILIGTSGNREASVEHADAVTMPHVWDDEIRDWIA
jgi:hypothetical protein